MDGVKVMPKEGFYKKEKNDSLKKEEEPNAGLSVLAAEFSHFLKEDIRDK